MSFATTGTIISAAAAAASLANMGYQAASGPPKVPDGASASREIAAAQAAMLPYQREIAAAQQMGTSVTVPTGPHKAKQDLVRLPSSGLGQVSVPGQPGRSLGRVVPYVASEWQPGGKYYKEGQATPDVFTKKVKVPGGSKEYDFAGYGTADIESELAREMTDLQIEMGKKYGTQFADEARKLTELSDPEGTKARALEYQLIQDQINKPPAISPLSGALDSQIAEQVKARGGIDSMERDLLDQAVMQANASRGGSVNAGQVEQALTTGYEGEARRNATMDKANAWLASGSTPEDINYRREQQNLANLGAFTAGQTPQSQFQNLSSAGQGAAPFYQGQQLPQQPASAGSQGGAYAANAFNANVNQQAGQANGWFAGLSGILNGLGTINQARA